MSQIDYEDLALVIEHLATKRSSPPQPAPQPPPPQLSSPAITGFFGSAPGWLTLLAALVSCMVMLSTRLSNVEYKAEISIADRAEIHRKIDAQADNYTQVKSDLAEIKTTLKELADRKK